METPHRSPTLLRTAVLSLLTACGPSKEICGNLLGEEGRAVKGVCLANQYATVDELRADCVGDVLQTYRAFPFASGHLGYDDGNVWDCRTEEDRKREEEAARYRCHIPAC